MASLDRLQVLTARCDLLRTVRDFFFELGFIEVQTPVLSRDTMVDATIDPIPVTLAGQDAKWYLQTSPEFAMKRLLTEGLERIFEITPVFRGGEIGDRHNPEFTMLEWYRVGDDYRAGRELLEQFAQRIFPERQVARHSYQQVFESHLQINPHTAEVSELESICHERAITIPDGMSDKDSLLQILMTEIVEPRLGSGTLEVIDDWPATQSALARLRETPQGYAVAERFELYVDGIELANGYHELLDPRQQRERMHRNNADRIRNGLASLPVDSRLLDAMESPGLPACCGVAVGFDRLLQVRLGLSKLSDVLTYGIDRA